MQGIDKRRPPSSDCSLYSPAQNRWEKNSAICIENPVIKPLQMASDRLVLRLHTNKGLAFNDDGNTQNVQSLLQLKNNKCKGTALVFKQKAWEMDHTLLDKRHIGRGTDLDSLAFSTWPVEIFFRTKKRIFLFYFFWHKTQRTFFKIGL